MPNGGKGGKNNLIPFSQRTEDEQRQIQSKGGKASGEARRKKRDLRQTMETILETPVKTPAIKHNLEQLGISTKGANLLTAVVAGLVKAAHLGNVKAFYAIKEILDEQAQGESEESRLDELLALWKQDADRSGGGDQGGGDQGGGGGSV